MSTPEQFALEIRQFAEKAKGRAHLVVRKIVLDMGTKIVARSPVGNPSLWKHPAPAGYTGGTFRANWMYGLDAAPRAFSLDKAHAADRTGKASLERLRAGLPKEAWGHVHYIVNNLPYASRLETGYSTQAPAGMVGITVREFQLIVAGAVGYAKAQAK